MNRSARNATVVKGMYFMMLNEMEKDIAVFGSTCTQGGERRDDFSTFQIHFFDVFYFFNYIF